MDTGNRITTTSASGASINQTSTPKQPVRTVGRPVNYAVSTPAKGLSVNQIVRGEVTDLRNKEVTVVLDDNTSLTAQLKNGSQLSIGDQVSFRITDIQPSKIYMEAIPQNAEALENSTIQKALEEAGLPRNEKNRTIVQELMNNSMSINKQSIQNILRQTYQWKDISIRTLVLMNKHQIPMTMENAIQFESYRSNEHQLLNRIQSIAGEIPSLLHTLAGNTNSNAVIPFGNQLISLFLPGSDSSSMLSEAMSESPSLADVGCPPSLREQLVSMLQNSGLEENALQDILTGKFPLRDAAHMLEAAMQKAYEIDNTNVANLQNQLIEEAVKAGQSPDMEAISKETAALAKALEAFDNDAVGQILSQFHDLQAQNHELGSCLTPTGRQELLTQLKEFPVPASAREGISSGDIAIGELLQAIRDTLPQTPPDAVKHLFQSPHFETLLEAQILHGWTLEPEALKKENSVKDYYDQMYDQTKNLETFMNQTIGNSKIGAELSGQSQNMRQNMDFMQTLNQMFSYVQLPLKLENQTANADLYVYTKKKNLKEHPSQISVLLHLDMEHLGPLDIHLALDRNQVNSKFYADDSDSLKLMQENARDLIEALAAQGYLIHAEFLPRERGMDIVKDFMEKDLSGSSLKRYTFDIRA